MAEPLRNDRPLSTADLADSRSRTNDSLAQDDLDARREGDPGGGPTLVHDRSVSGFVADESTSDLNALSSRDEQKMSALDRMDSSDNTRFDAASLSPTAARTATPTTEPAVAGLRPSGQPPQGGRPATNAAAETPLLSNSELSDLRSQWSNIQAEFVDEPRRSVQQADQLVATAMQRLAEGFA